MPDSLRAGGQVADDLARRGWSQPDIRRELMRDGKFGWVAADTLATIAIRHDNTSRTAAMTGRAA